MERFVLMNGKGGQVGEDYIVNSFNNDTILPKFKKQPNKFLTTEKKICYNFTITQFHLKKEI